MYYVNTRAGTFRIEQRSGRWHVLFEDESLGAYRSPQHAVDDLVGGHCSTPSRGIDTSALGIPDDIDDWKRSR